MKAAPLPLMALTPGTPTRTSRGGAFVSASAAAAATIAPPAANVRRAGRKIRVRAGMGGDKRTAGQQSRACRI